MARSTCSRSADGFSLVEVLVAAALLAVSLVAVAQLFITSTRANQNARTSTFATALAQQKLEQLRSLVWSFDNLNNPVSDFQTNLTVTPPTAAGGPGLSASPSNALTQSTTGYVDYLDASGAWVGTGTTPVTGTMYVRRWSVTPLPDDPTNTLVLQVLVTRRPTGSSAVSSSGTRLPDQARLMSLKTRKSR